MSEAPIPDNETKRLLSLLALNILDTPLDERFERITRVARRALNVPVAAISLIDESRQWFKSIQGLNITETPRSSSFCAYTILNDAVMTVSDATLDARFAANPFVTEAPHVRSYAGYPLSLERNLRLGTLCVIDYQPREFSDNEVAILQDLAKMVESELTSIMLSKEQLRLMQELHQAEKEVKIDSLTKLWNRKGIDSLLFKQWDFSARRKFPIGLAMIDFDDFKHVNDTYGHPVGDEVIRGVAHMLLSALRSYDAVGRWGGDEFMILLPGATKKEVEMTLKRIQTEIFFRTPIITSQGPIKITVSMGAVSAVPKEGYTLEQFIKQADDELFKAKKAGKGRIEITA